MGEAGRVLSEEQVRRYSRHLILPEVGGNGQRKLLNAKVLLVGAGPPRLGAAAQRKVTFGDARVRRDDRGGSAPDEL